jgi:hypothetical protein
MAAPGHVNPALTVQAYFMVPVEGDYRRTQFRLRDYPDVALWLLSFVEHLMARQGKLRGEHRVADPPGGSTRQALLDGGVLLTQRQPDGRTTLRLNPAMEMGLYVHARVPGRPAVDTAFNLGGDPELSRWLLNQHVPGNATPDPATLSPELVASLRRNGALVDELPPPDACFPDPEAPVDTAAELATMERVIPQAAGQPLPPAVRVALGAHTPALPRGVPLLWGEDAGTGLVFPVIAPAGSPVPTMPGPAAAARAAFWDRQRAEAAVSLKERRYATLREIIPPAQRVQLRHYVRQLVARGYFPELGVDLQVARRASIHKEPTLGALHRSLATLFSRIAGQPLIGSFCQLGVYEEGAVLERHTDRPQCILNLSLVLDMSGPAGEPDPWPIYMAVNGETVAVDLEVGDGLIYSGVEIEHWRDPLPPGQRAIAGFFFFVPPDFRGTLN